VCVCVYVECRSDGYARTVGGEREREREREVRRELNRSWDEV